MSRATHILALLGLIAALAACEAGPGGSVHGSAGVGTGGYVSTGIGVSL